MKEAVEHALTLRKQCYSNIHYHPTWQDATRLAIFVNAESLQTLLSVIGDQPHMWTSDENDKYKLNIEIGSELLKYLNKE